MTVWISSYEKLKPRHDAAPLLNFLPLAYSCRLRLKNSLGLVSCWSFEFLKKEKMK